MYRSILLFLVLSGSLFPANWINEFKDLIEQNEFGLALKKLKDQRDHNYQKHSDNHNKLISYYYFRRSIFHRKQGKLKAASYDMDLALAATPGDIEIQKARAYLYVESNQVSNAYQLIETFITKLQGHDRKNFNLLLAKSLIKQERLFQAMQLLKNHQLEFPNDIAAMIELARLHLKLENYESAADIYKLLINLKPSKEFDEGLRKAQHGVEVNLRTVHSYSASFKIRIEDKHFEKYYPLIFEELENCASRLNRVFGYEPRGLVTILFLNRLDFAKWNHLSNYVQGISDGESWQIRIPINRVQNFENKNALINTLYHEYSHHLVRLITRGRGKIPMWFHEGLARFLEPYRDHVLEKRILRSLIHKNKLFESEKIPVHFGMNSESYEAYLQSGSIVGFLDKIKCLDNLIAGLSEFTEGTNFSDKLVETCALTESEMVAQWKNWITNNVMREISEY